MYPKAQINFTFHDIHTLSFHVGLRPQTASPLVQNPCRACGYARHSELVSGMLDVDRSVDRMARICGPTCCPLGEFWYGNGWAEVPHV